MPLLIIKIIEQVSVARLKYVLLHPENKKN